MSLPEILFPEIADWVREHGDPSRSRCFCGRELRGDQVKGYRHEAGWMTDAGRMWSGGPGRAGDNHYAPLGGLIRCMLRYQGVR